MSQKKIVPNIKFVGIGILGLILVSVICFVIYSLNKDEVIIPNNSLSQICAQIGRKRMQNYCLAIVNNDRDQCNKITGDDKLACLAIVDNNPELCLKIKSRKTCIIELARVNDNIASCNFSDDKNNCVGTYFAGLYWDERFNLMDQKYCETFPDDDKNWCLALVTQDKSVCGNVPACLSLFPQPLSFCDNQQSLKKEGCLRDRAMTQKDPTICELIDDTNNRNLCYFGFVGHINPDISFCSKISDRELSQLCLVNAVTRLLLLNK